MKSSKNVIILLLALTTVGGALLAWRQYTELVELRAVAMNRDERADLQKRIWDLEKSLRETQDQLLAARASNPAELENMLATAAEKTDENRRSRGGRDGNGRGRGGPPPQFTALRELMNKPEIQTMVASQQKAAIENRYGALLANLNLSPEQQEKLKTLLAERLRTSADVFDAARAQGIDPRENPDAFRKLMASARDEIESSIKATIGSPAYEQLQNYERTMPQRALVNEIQQRLSYSNSPLSAAQAEQLVQTLATNTPPPPASAGTNPSTPPVRDGAVEFRGPGGPGFGPGPGRGPDMGMIGAMIGGGPGSGMIGAVLDGRGPGSVPITNNAITQAQTFLTQPQVAVLQQVQQQQQTQQQLTQAVRETLSTASQTTGSRSSNTTSGGASPPTGNPSPRRRPGG